MMKSLLLSLALVVGGVAVTESGDAARTAADEIRAIELERNRAILAGDVATLERLTSDDYTFVTQRGSENSKDYSGDNRFTRVYVKQGGRWVSVALQVTLVEKPR